MSLGVFCLEFTQLKLVGLEVFFFFSQIGMFLTTIFAMLFKYHLFLLFLQVSESLTGH